MRLLLLIAITVSLNVSLARAESREPITVGILGDSGATGAAAHPMLVADQAYLASLLIASLGADSMPGLAFLVPTKSLPLDYAYYAQPAQWQIPLRMPAPTRVFNSKNTKQRQTAMGIRAAMIGDTPEYSWGYMVGLRLGADAKNIVFAAQDGTRVEDIPEQIHRISEHFGDKLPRYVFLSFTGNDMCSGNIFNENGADLRRWYKERYAKGLEMLAALPSVSSEGTDIYLMANFDVVQVASSLEVLQKVIPINAVQNGTLPTSMTCEQVRRGHPARPEFIVNACRGVLNTRPDETGKLAYLKTLWNDYIASQVQSLNELKNTNSSVRFHHIMATAQIQFNRHDIANDCFHPSIRAHEKIANTLWNAAGLKEKSK